MDLFGTAGAIDGNGRGDGSLRADAAATLALAKGQLRAFGEDWHELHSLSVALRSPAVSFCPASGEPALRGALAAVVAAADALARIDPELVEAAGVDLDSIEAARDEAASAMEGMRGPVVTHERVRDALSRRWPDRGVATAVRGLLARLDDAGARPVPSPEAGRTTGPRP